MPRRAQQGEVNLFLLEAMIREGTARASDDVVFNKFSKLRDEINKWIIKKFADNHSE